MQTGFLRRLSILYAALLMGQLLFLGVAYFLGQNVEMTENVLKMKDTLQMIAPAMAIGGLLGGGVLYRSFLGKIDKNADITTKLNSYQTASILRYALLEGPSIFASVCFLLTGDLIFLGLSGIIILAFVFHRPTKDKIALELNLSSKETELL